jgi:glycosyltransferase involved in cell wall biosynthesis
VIKCTVGICSFNGSSRIGAVLDRLSKQVEVHFEWEILIIDNASTDDTSRVSMEVTERLELGNVRVVMEDRLGLAYARQRAAAEARGEFVIFLDDDNLPEPDFVSKAAKFFDEHPKAGMVGGIIYPVWDAPPSKLAQKVCEFALAICNRGDEAFAYQGACSGPVGAGMCIRTMLLRNILLGRNEDLPNKVTGRRGSALSGGEDIAISVLSHRLGWENWYDPSLRCGHVIPERRMNFEYLNRIFRFTGESQASVRRLTDWKARNPLTALIIAGKDIFRLLRTSFQNGLISNHFSKDHLTEQLAVLDRSLLKGRIIETMRWWK